MIKCSVCQFENEDGALFCERCKSSIDVVEPVPAMTPSVEEVLPSGDIPLVAEPVGDGPMAVVVEAASVQEIIPFAADNDETVAIAAPPPVAAVAPAEEESAPTAAAEASPLPRLVVVRGMKMNMEYPIYEGDNFIGRADEKAVDIDLEEQESEDRIWSSRQHAVVTLAGGELTVEDLKSTNGTFVNRLRLQPGEKKPLQADDVIQVGTVHLKVKY